MIQISENDKLVGKRLKWIREELRLTANKFAANLYMSGNTIRNIECGSQRMSKKTIALICKIYSVNDNFLKNGEYPIFREDFDEDNFNKENGGERNEKITKPFLDTVKKLNKLQRKKLMEQMDLLLIKQKYEEEYNQKSQ